MDSISGNADQYEKKKFSGILPAYSNGLLGKGKLFSGEENDHLKDGCWGFWSTLGFSAIICIFYIVLSVMGAGILYGIELAANPELDENTFSENLLTNGFLLSIVTLLTTWSTVGLVILFVALREGITIRDYLDFKPVSIAVVLRWIAVTILFLYIWDAIYELLDLVESDFVIKAYNSAGNRVLFWIAVVIAAPVAEEFFFRGFLFEGIRSSKLGPIGAILITSIAWGFIHQQYGTHEIMLIGSFGIVLGIAKIKTRSLYTPIALHGAFNLIAMVQVSATA